MELQAAPSAANTNNLVQVDFDGPFDPYNPINWPAEKKLRISVLYSATSMASVWASTAYAPATSDIARQFNASSEVVLLGTSLLLLGWGFGPLIWAPLSEIHGRKWPILLPFLVSTIFSLATGIAGNIPAILATRFLTGFFGSAPITCAGGAFVDMWRASERGNLFVVYTICVCGLPAIAPVVGGAIVVSRSDWRWVQYITAIIQIVVFIFDLIYVEESYKPTLLEAKACKLQKATGNVKFRARDVPHFSPADLALKFGLRPLQILMTPICLLITIYSSFIYGVYYASLASFPILFQDTRGWNPLVGALPFLGMMLGIFLGAGLSAWSQKYYICAYESNGFRAVPEARLPPMMIASPILASSLFVIGWTSWPWTPWIATVIGIFLLGFSYYVIFTSALNYLVDSFQRWSASALAANTFARSVFAAALPLSIPRMFARLGNQWSFTVLAVFAVLNIPTPFIFWRYGAHIRARGRFTSG